MTGARAEMAAIGWVRRRSASRVAPRRRRLPAPPCPRLGRPQVARRTASPRMWLQEGRARLIGCPMKLEWLSEEACLVVRGSLILPRRLGLFSGRLIFFWSEEA